MRYHPEQKKAFCHIPRTAGRSIYRNWVGCKDVPQSSGFSQHMHSLPSKYIEHNNFLNDFEWFTVTRNPYDRIISLWLFKLQFLGCTLEEVESTIPALPRVLFGAYKNGFRGKFSIRSLQSKKIDYFGFHVQTANPMRVAKECNLVFKYEQLEEVEDYLKIKLIERVPDRPSLINFDIFKTPEYISTINHLFEAEFQEFGYDKLTN